MKLTCITKVKDENENPIILTEDQSTSHGRCRHGCYCYWRKNRDMDMNSWMKRLDYRESGGACLLGVNGNIIIAHGRSQATAIKNAIGLAKQTVERNIRGNIEEGSYEQTRGRR